MNRPARHWLWLLLLVPVVLGLWRLQFDVEVLNLLPSRSPAVQGVRLFQENFANARELIITYAAADPAETEAAARAVAMTLRGATNLVREVHWQPPWEEHPGQSAELLAFLWFNQPHLHVLSNRLSDAAITNALAEAREQLATSLSPEALARGGYDPFKLTALPGDAGLSAMETREDFFASADGTFRVTFVEAAVELGGYRECIAWLKQIQALVEGARADPAFPKEVIVSYTGRPAFAAEIGAGMQSDFAGPSTISGIL